MTSKEPLKELSIDELLCVACKSPLGRHSKNDLVMCLFRVQASWLTEVKKNIGIKKYSNDSRGGNIA